MRLKTLNGAPFSRELDFTEPALLPIPKCGFFATSWFTARSAYDTQVLSWRQIGTKDTRLSTGWSQPFLPGSRRLSVDFYPSMTLPQVDQSSTMFPPHSTRDDTAMTLDDPPSVPDTFVQHSLIFHDTLLSSQVALDTTSENTISSSSFLNTSFTTTTSASNSPTRNVGPTPILQVPPKTTILSLGAIPSAQHLRALYPQTPTPNVLCVLTAQPEHREVFVRKGEYKMELYEIIVADDTRSDFKITFWLRPQQQSNKEQLGEKQALLEVLKTMQVGDILLVQKIALTSFRDTVHGQSLNLSIARARTTIDVLARSNGVLIAQLDELPEEITVKFKRVKKWAKSYVAAADGGSRKRRGASTVRGQTEKRKPTSSLNDDSMPPDTLASLY
ncbi:hypothetical protein BDU57DRAFT_524449 [Ampelomyces quisqualis]|uniref:Uncharacterized protein n=1 Tax=Ampelomyces quisqualis TaxID=50730 RepID=A0A6A5Q7D3_AMPQU|nr:hypothetical protein BDU57DRAFT_524449 [Ampelomyces quisqualis]